MDLIEINEYCTLIEKWYKDTYNVEYNEYEAEDNYADKFEISMGFLYEGSTKDQEYIRVDIVDKNKVFLNKIKYGFSSFPENYSCLS